MGERRVLFTAPIRLKLVRRKQWSREVDDPIKGGGSHINLHIGTQYVLRHLSKFITA